MTPFSRTKELRRVSAKRRRVNMLRAGVREAVFRRDGGCLAADVPGLGPCFGVPTPHHIVKEGQGGPYTEDNLITLCAHHNDLLEADADAAAIAKDRGWVKTGHQKIRGCA